MLNFIRASRTLSFVFLTFIILLIGIGYIAKTLSQRRIQKIAFSSTSPDSRTWKHPSAEQRPGLLFRSTTLDSTYGKVMWAPLEAPNTNRRATPIEAERIYFAGGHGICLLADRGVLTTYSAALFSSDFKPNPSFLLTGVPSRARVSPDGKIAAITVFVSGHSYAGTDFSTATTLIDTKSGSTLANLEDFKITHQGGPLSAHGANFWGVTFARQSNRFYATLSTGGIYYLVEGDVAARSVRTLCTGVECPSLSPDNTRVAFKKRESPSRWRLHVLDLATFNEQALNEKRSVNDQVEWLDNDHVLYTLSNGGTSSGSIESIWVVPTQGPGQAKLFAQGASCPVVLR